MADTTKVTVTLTMELTVEGERPLNGEEARMVIDQTEDAIRHRLMGAGFLPDEIYIENYGFASREGD